MPLTAYDTLTRPAQRTKAPEASRTPAPSALPGRLLRALVGAVLVLALVGAVLTGLQLTGGSGDEAGPTPPPGLVTPYGRLTIGTVTVSAVAATADKGVVGKGHAAHQTPGAETQTRVNVPLTLQNDSDATVSYSPAQFRLDVGTGAPVAPQDGALLTGDLRPEAALALRLTFAVPAGATSARLLVDGGRPSTGLDLALPAAGAPAQQMTPQDQAQQDEAPGSAGAHTSGSGGH